MAEEKVKEAEKKPSEKPQGGKPDGGSGGGRGPRPMTKMQIAGFFIGIIACLVVWFMPPFWGLEAAGQHFVAILALCIVWWFTNPIPPQFTALLLMALPWILGVTSASNSFGGFTSSTTWFIFGALLLGKMVSDAGLILLILALMINLRNMNA